MRGHSHFSNIRWIQSLTRKLFFCLALATARVRSKVQLKRTRMLTDNADFSPREDPRRSASNPFLPPETNALPGGVVPPWIFGLRSDRMAFDSLIERKQPSFR